MADETDEPPSLTDEYEAYIQGWWISLRWTRQIPTQAIKALAEGLVKVKQESERVTNYHLGSDPGTQHSFRHHGEFAHQHDDEAPHAHEGGSQFHHHYPGVPPGYEPAFLEG